MLEHIRVATALLGAGLLARGLPANAAEPAATVPQACEAQRQGSSDAAPGYRVTRARSRALPGDTLQVCDLTVQSSSRAVLRVSMPATGWNGALVEVRCGAECRAPTDHICDSIVARGYACWSGAGGSVEASHEALSAAKAVVASHYVASPTAAVLLACAAGAGRGLHQAAAFPADFQGIVAGAPVLDVDAHRRRLQWLADTLHSPRGKPLLAPADLARLHAQALAACDADDGLSDGLISDPLRCQVPTRALQCADGDGPSCLRPEQIEAIDRIYAGPPGDPAAGQLPGSELGWARPGHTPRPAGAAPVIDRPQPDLQEYAAAGGKLLLFQGLADTEVAPRQTAELYERYTRTLGGTVKATGYIRLFMIPGMQHCTGGEGPYQVDFLRGIENWTVKARRAPDDLIAFHPRATTAPVGSVFAPAASDPAQQVFSSWQVGVTVTLAESRLQPKSSFSRPIYVYPVHTHYKGVGDPNFWRSFYGPYDYPYLLK